VLSVFAKPEDDAAKVREAILKLVPFELEAEKLALEDNTAQGFNQRTIHVFRITLLKDRHIKEFWEAFEAKLSKQQRLQLLQEAESRLDSELMFYIRIDKDLWEQGIVQLTDSGHCYHLKFAVAAFPHKREAAMEVLTKVFKQP
jgi:RNA binding exosome subunit